MKGGGFNEREQGDGATARSTGNSESDKRIRRNDDRHEAWDGAPPAGGGHADPSEGVIEEAAGITHVEFNGKFNAPIISGGGGAYGKSLGAPPPAPLSAPAPAPARSGVSAAVAAVGAGAGVNGGGGDGVACSLEELREGEACRTADGPQLTAMTMPGGDGMGVGVGLGAGRGRADLLRAVSRFAH